MKTHIQSKRPGDAAHAVGVTVTDESIMRGSDEIRGS